MASNFEFHPINWPIELEQKDDYGFWNRGEREWGHFCSKKYCYPFLGLHWGGNFFKRGWTVIRTILRWNDFEFSDKPQNVVPIPKEYQYVLRKTERENFASALCGRNRLIYLYVWFTKYSWKMVFCGNYQWISLNRFSISLTTHTQNIHFEFRAIWMIINNII